MQKKIKKLIELRKIKWKKHALKRMLERHIKRIEVFEAISDCTIIETHSVKRPLQTFLVLGYYKNQPLHVMLAIDEIENILWIITVYKPTLDEWRENFKSRR